MPLLQIKDYSFSYALSKETAISNINLDINDGEIISICGESGSGKSTLLKSLKTEISPEGKKQGEIISNVKSIDISIVFQNYNTQLVTGTVINDLVFQMENLGIDNTTMRKRLSETVGFFGIENLLHKDVEDLSGGQKQLITLASAMMLKPKLLLLDEPMSQLDPIASRNFLDMLKRINEEFGVSMIITEHRLDDIIAITDKIVLMEKGKIIHSGTPNNIFKTIWSEEELKTTAYIPQIPRSSLTINPEKDIAFTPKEFQQENHITTIKTKPQHLETSIQEINKDKKKIVKLRNLLFSYENGYYILKNLNFNVYENEILCLLGGNGSGKSTLLKILAKIYRPYMGKTKIKAKKIGYMPQDLNAYFISDIVEEDIWKDIEKNKENLEYFNYLISELSLKHLLKRHPYDLSGGEQQKVVLASILLKKPDFIILDEPTKGIDPLSKIITAKLLKETNTTIIFSTHDLEFAAFFAERCVMLFDGDISFEETPHRFFQENNYYTTALNKATKTIYDDIITYSDVLKAWQLEKPNFTPEY